MKSSKSRGALWGLFLADSLALGPHWIYDTTEIARVFGQIDRLQAPATSYHPGKTAGAQTHLGDQALVLLQASRAGFDSAKFMAAWVNFWENPLNLSYRDHATQETLANLAAGGAGSRSEELAGPARGLVLVPELAELGETREAVLQAVHEQTRLTHYSELAETTATFLAGVVYDVLQGQTIAQAVESNAVGHPLIESALQLAKSYLEDNDVLPVIAKLGQSCVLPGALASVLFLALRFADDPIAGLTQNALAGGDSAARGLVLGAILGARHGFEIWPKNWVETLQAGPILESVCGEMIKS